MKPEDCKDVPEKGKGKALLSAYEIAAEGHDLEYFKTVLDEHAAAMQADIDAKDAREAEKAAKADRKKRKSEAKNTAEDVDMEDADAEVESKKSSKKRKKEVDEDEDEDEKVSSNDCSHTARSDSDHSLPRPQRPQRSS